MDKERLEVQEDKLFMWDGSGGMSEQRLDELTMVQVVSLENGLFQGEEPFYVLVFSERVWVVPDDAAGLVKVWKAIRPFAQGRVKRVVDAHLPWRWRKRVLGVLPLFPLPRMGAFDASSVPKWSSVVTVGPEQYDELV